MRFQLSDAWLTLIGEMKYYFTSPVTTYQSLPPPSGPIKLTKGRIQDIRDNLPPGSQDIPIQEVRPETPPPANPK